MIGSTVMTSPSRQGATRFRSGQFGSSAPRDRAPMPLTLEHAHDREAAALDLFLDRAASVHRAPARAAPRGAPS
jgi:hypothetical protein